MHGMEMGGGTILCVMGGGWCITEYDSRRTANC